MYQNFANRVFVIFIFDVRILPPSIIMLRKTSTLKIMQIPLAYRLILPPRIYFLMANDLNNELKTHFYINQKSVRTPW
jgi:hypothetical protein